MKVLIGWFGHETNTFSRRKTDFDLLISQGCWYEKEIIDVFTGTPSYLGGMIKCANENNIELIPTFGVENAGPQLSDACVEKTLNILLSYVKDHLGEYDGICLGLHGAGVSESHDDLETYVLKRVRDIVGWEMPITVTLDLHGNISKGMCKHANGLFGIKENPHVDYETTGYEAMDALRRHINGEITVKTDVVPLPMLVPITVTKDYHEVNEFIKKYKKDNNLLDLAFFPGFPYSDTPITQASVFVTGDGDQIAHVKKVASYVWDNRELIVNIDALDANEAVEKASEFTKENGGLCVINEEADNPGAGTPGDGTFLIESMIKANLEDSAFAYLYDPETVRRAHEAGVGELIDIELGGKIEEEEIHGKPLKLSGVQIRTLSDGNFIATTPLMKNIPGSFGPTAGLRYKNVDFVVASVQNQTYDDRAFVVGGIDISQKKVIGLKSSQHFKAFYKALSEKIIPANPMGLSTRNLNLFSYDTIVRPMYPIDENVEF
ncbi:M81 family metallopeptidase [Acidaminobacter sp. JC074]|uniref:M81 family metallopeptidase n=1 Tax=Acidaminobacter sp. JC074 TaxID=2530199 RepID=UPI001F0FF3F9|nr:M81 family metallopeptidase [Acidaminobacter sp. JC074]MCH4887889.1 M81 family metallopeptidase [Acidaminobacter sp. JC074]